MDFKGVKMNKNLVLLGAKCSQEHGGAWNSAIFYGHPGRSGVCIKVNGIWIDQEKLEIRGDLNEEV